MFQEVRQSRGEEVLVYLVGTKVRDWRTVRKLVGVLGRKTVGKLWEDHLKMWKKTMAKRLNWGQDDFSGDLSMNYTDHIWSHAVRTGRTPTKHYFNGECVLAFKDDKIGIIHLCLDIWNIHPHTFYMEHWICRNFAHLFYTFWYYLQK